MLERLDAAVTAALNPLQTAMESKAADEVVQPLAQVRLSRWNLFTYLCSICCLVLRRNSSQIVISGCLDLFA